MPNYNAVLLAESGDHPLLNRNPKAEAMRALDIHSVFCRWSVSAQLACLAFLLPSLAEADIAPNPLSGGVSLGRDGGATDQVAMVEETVRLVVTKSRCSTSAIFTMKNVTKTPIDLQVGFPFAFDKDLQDFVAKVDGELVNDVKESSGGRGRRWKIWKMTFPADKTTVIEVSYHNQLQTISSWVVGLALRGVDRTLLEKASDVERRELQEKLICRDLTYILRTGRGWAGPIGRCRIEVAFDGFGTNHLLPRYPRPLLENGKHRHAPMVSENKIVWDVDNYEPESDVYLQVTPFISRQETHELLTRFHKRSPDDPYVVRHLAEYLRAEGRLDEEQALLEQLLKNWQPRIALWGAEASDTQSLDYSREVWGVVRLMIGMSGREREAKNPQRAAKLIEPMAKKLREQIELASPNDRFAKLFRPQIDAALAWCQKQTGANTPKP